jgi:hypothetical protein
MSDLKAEHVYAQTCSDIRATDDISFKLMGVVPLVSGATLLTLFLKEPLSEKATTPVTAFALFAALITLGLFRWELRNIQNCKWLRDRAEALEGVAVGEVRGRPEPPLKIGKTEAEKWIYSVTILAWLIVPPLVTSVTKTPWLRWAYATSAALIAITTAVSAFRPVRADGRPLQKSS